MNRLLIAALPLLIVTPAFAQDAQGGGAMPASETKAEAEARAQLAFGLLDANQDGVVTQDEANAFAARASDNPRVAGRVMKTFTESDANHDGKVTWAEAKARADAAFDAADTNHDGVLSPEERMAAKAKSAAQQ
jgi:Ca2+-binding EF-hand superfamily protein